ncbi:MAG: 3-isopropylmalate dehydratase small subunit [Burkholderiales bacterium]|nr:3-isopropylmalate dehydratase small subunit [Burkholderiales bacterium]
MEKFTVLNSVAAPLMLANVDTDLIIRIERLYRLDRGELGAWAFESLRYLSDDRENPQFLLNQPPWRGARILLAAENFGCGSSREGAVWALWDLGVRCVIAPSFGDIFYNNCIQNGMLPLRLAAEQVESLAAEAKNVGGEISVDLAAQQVRTASGRLLAFDIEPGQRETLLKGLDAISLTLAYSAEIDKYQERDRMLRPWLYRKA